MLRQWNGVGIPDSTLKTLGFEEQPRAAAGPVSSARRHAFVRFSRLRSARPGDAGLDVGRTSPVVRTAQGFAVAHVIAREPARPLTLDEAIDRARRGGAREETEWVLNQLERRAAAGARRPGVWMR